MLTQSIEFNLLISVTDVTHFICFLGCTIKITYTCPTCHNQNMHWEKKLGSYF